MGLILSRKVDESVIIAGRDELTVSNIGVDKVTFTLRLYTPGTLGAPITSLHLLKYDEEFRVDDSLQFRFYKKSLAQCNIDFLRSTTKIVRKELHERVSGEGKPKDSQEHSHESQGRE